GSHSRVRPQRSRGTLRSRCQPSERSVVARSQPKLCVLPRDGSGSCVALAGCESLERGEKKMKGKLWSLSLAVLLFPIYSWAQNPAVTTQGFVGNGQSFGIQGKFRYYLNETYLNPSVFTPAFRAGIRMANPLGKGATEYPPEWRQGSEAFGRNGD